MSLVEFLLARIGEDERRWTNPALVRLTGPWPTDLVRKMLAECEAKRRIVGMALETETLGILDEPWYRVVAALASVYADHPDYLPEWSPSAVSSA